MFLENATKSLVSTESSLRYRSLEAAFVRIHDGLRFDNEIWEDVEVLRHRFASIALNAPFTTTPE